MHTAKRAIRRLVLIGWMGFFGLMGLSAPLAQAATPPERVLPDSTIFLLKVNDVKSLREAFRGSQYGQLWNDPAMKDFKDDLVQKIEEASKPIKERLGISLDELLALPQGALAVAAISRDDPKMPVAVAILADAGTNKDKMADVLTRATEQAKTAGAKTSQESFNGLTIHVLQAPPDDKPKDNDKSPSLSVSWTHSDGIFYFGLGTPGTDIDVIKDLTAHREGRDNSLASNEAFVKTQAKIDSAKSQVLWFLDIAKLVKQAIKATARGNEGQAQQNEILADQFGVNGLKSAGGCFTLGAGNYDGLSKTFFLAPKPVQGLLKIFSFPTIAIRPEPWVPGNVASYQSFSWDLDNAFEAINEIINQFNPGILALVEQQLVGPNGGEPLSLQKDLFGPLGNRITLVTDFKKPIKEDSQRMLLGVALQDAKVFQNTVNRLFEIAQSTPRKRDFQGTTIYDVELPNINPNGGGGNGQLRSISFAIAKETFFVTTDTTLLEQVLRPGNTLLGDNAGFQSVVKEIPERVSGMSFARPDESARLTYDLFKSGQIDKAIQQAMGGRAPQQGQIPPIGKILATEKLPDFSVFAKYLAIRGSYSVMDDDGFIMTGFTLRRSGP
jgi:hypothetical protein